MRLPYASGSFDSELKAVSFSACSRSWCPPRPFATVWPIHATRAAHRLHWILTTHSGVQHVQSSHVMHLPRQKISSHMSHSAMVFGISSFTGRHMSWQRPHLADCADRKQSGLLWIHGSPPQLQLFDIHLVSDSHCARSHGVLACLSMLVCVLEGLSGGICAIVWDDL